MTGNKVYNFSRGGMTAKEYIESFADLNNLWDINKKSDCYIIALGVNDILNMHMPIGNINDIDLNNYHNNKDTFCGWYAKIVQKYKEINSTAKFFFVTMPKENRVNDKLKVVFIENYGVSLAEKIIPAANVSEQISTTTKEASGTSNMKFMMNGAITLATLDGANVEIHEQVGDDNIVLFGLLADQVLEYNKYGGYSSADIYSNNFYIKRVVDDLINGFIPNIVKEGREIYNSLITYNDEFFVLRDFENYIKAQKKVNNLYKDKNKWNEMSLINIANSGIFSTDRTISEYARDIWYKK
jgi:glycogen/starch/alpha-glucan phosphorylase-like protein